MPKEARKKDMQIQTEKNTETYSRTNLYNQGILYFPTKVNDPDEVETCLVPNPDLEFYETELSDLFEGNSHWNITAPAYYVLTNSRDDQFIREMISDNQVNAMTAKKLEQFIEEAFNKFSNSSQDAINYLYDNLIESFLSTDNKSLNVIY